MKIKRKRTSLLFPQEKPIIAPIAGPVFMDISLFDSFAVLKASPLQRGRRPKTKILLRGFPRRRISRTS